MTGGLYESSEIVGAFLDEVEEQLQYLEEGILVLEADGDNMEVIQKVFRAAHTLKGASAVMRFEVMKQLTHEMENVLDKIRNQVLVVNTNVVNVLFRCLDLLRQLRQDFVADHDNVQTDITFVVNELKALLLIKSGAESAKATAAPALDAPAAGFVLDAEQQAVLKAAAEVGQGLWDCRITLLPDSIMRAIRAFVVWNFLQELGHVVATQPVLAELPEDTEEREFNFLLVSVLDAAALIEKIRQEMMDIENVTVTAFTLPATVPPATSLALAVSATAEAGTPEKAVSVKEPAAAAPEKKVSQTVRVDVDRLEKMMNLVGELVIGQTRIAQVGNVLHNRYMADMAVDELLTIANHVSRVVSELQEGVMKARMLPIQQLFNRFPRMVRDLAQTLGKEVELVLEGGETELDRTIIEDVADPLIHLVRNAIDHGIESPEVRLAAGKPAKGLVRMKAFHQENHVIIAIEDDGGGINAERIRQSAVKKNLLTQQAAEDLSDQEALQLIFHSGFSTAQTVSDVSGRGVGMDIVRNHIDRLNGIIDVQTKLGEGTRFTVELPLTLAILSGLLIKISGAIYALPMNNVLEIVRKAEVDIESINGQSVAVIRGKVLPLIWLHDYFGTSRPRRGRHVFIVILGVAEKRLGLVVDELVGNQEIVVKTLGSYIGKVEGFSGATILGDGSVACILDVVGVAKMIGSRKVSECLPASDAAEVI